MELSYNTARPTKCSATDWLSTMICNRGLTLPSNCYPDIQHVPSQILPRDTNFCLTFITESLALTTDRISSESFARLTDYGRKLVITSLDLWTHEILRVLEKRIAKANCILRAAKKGWRTQRVTLLNRLQKRLVGCASVTGCTRSARSVNKDSAGSNLQLFAVYYSFA